MYTHKILPTIISNGNFLSSQLIDKSVRQVVFNNDSLLRSNDIALLQDIPLTQLNTISQYLNKNIYKLSVISWKCNLSSQKRSESSIFVIFHFLPVSYL